MEFWYDANNNYRFLCWWLYKITKANWQCGKYASKIIFSDTSHVLVNSRIRFWNYFELDGKNSTFELQENVSTSIFGEQILLIGSKLSKGAAGWDLHNVIFEGNRDNQKYVPTKNREHPNAAGNWGNGYHNFIGLFVPEILAMYKPQMQLIFVFMTVKLTTI